MIDAAAPTPPARRVTLRVAAATGLAAVVTLAAALPVAAQVREAALPRPGEIWLEVSPSLLDWTERFGPGGGRVPLSSDLEGPIADRIYPGVDPLLSDLNADAAALGFEPLEAAELDLGSLHVGVVSAQVRRIDARLEVGILERLSVEVGAPAVFTEVEPLFGFDPGTATVAPGQVALPAAGSFFGSIEAARSTLENRVQEGTLTPEEEADALALLQTSGAFLEALQRRVAQNRLIPLASSPAGMELAALYASLGEGFAGFDLTLPELDLVGELTAADLEALFEASPIGSAPPGTVENGWGVPYAEVGLRVAVWNGLATGPGPLRHRTTVGARVRLPVQEAVGRPGGTFLPLEIPIEDARREVEVSAQEEVRLGDTFRLDAAGRYALRMSSSRTGRVVAPGRPFALALTETVIERDPGELVQIQAVPQVRLNPFLAVGLAYGFEWWGEDEVRIAASPDGLSDARALELGTGGTRHRIGLSAFLRTGLREPGAGPPPPAGVEEEGGEEPPTDEGARWRLAFTIQGAVAGSGIRTPASRVVSFSIRAPLQLF